MVRIVKPVVSLVVFAVWAVLPWGAFAEEKQPGENASERSPDATARGTTYDEGPKNVLAGGKKESKKDEKAEPAKKDEAADKDKEKADKEKVKADKEKAKAEEQARKEAEKAEKKAKKEKEQQEKEAKEKAAKEEAGTPDEGKVATGDQKKGGCKCGTCAKCKAKAAAAAVPAEPTPEQKAAEAEAARLKAQQEERLRVLVKQLGTSGWREAQGELLAAGKVAVPILIDGMSLPEADKLQAYNLGGHTKADAGRAPRQRTIAEVCAELLTSMVRNHSNYKGEVPGADQKAWQEWWAANSGTVVFAK